MRPLTTLVAILFLVTIGHQCLGQNQGLGGWGKIVQGITGDRTPSNSQNVQGLPSLQGLSGMLGGGNQNIGSSPSPFGGLQNLFGGGLPNLGGGAQTGQTDLLGRMNQKSKEAIDRTTQWAQQKKQQMSSKMFSGAFDMLKPKMPLAPQGGQGNGLLQGAAGAFDWLKPSSNLPMNQPPIQSAENYGQQPSMRY